MSYTGSSMKGGWGKSKSLKSISRSQKAGLQCPMGLRRMKKMMRKQTLIPSTTSRASSSAVGKLLLYIINKKSRNAPFWASRVKRCHRVIGRRCGWHAECEGEQRCYAPWARRRSPLRPSKASSPNRTGGSRVSPVGGDSKSPSLSISLHWSSH